MSNDMNEFKRLVGVVANGTTLSFEEARTAFDIMMSGDATPSQMGAFLMALRLRGETIDEISGGAMTMREKALPITAPAGAIDVVGTGGDGTGTFNISTGTSMVVAACGVPVAKHGNRAASSKSGAADVLMALGVNIDCAMPLLEKALRECGLCFMMAPRHHGAMRHVGGTRVEMGTRTIFNLLGPLSNPAGVSRQLMGVFAREWVEPLAHVLKKLGSERVWVVHGSDGSDEMTTTGPTHVAELKDGEVSTFDVTPEEAGLPLAQPADLKGGDAETNALAITAMLDGHPGPYRDVVLYNSAGALVIAGKADSLKDGVKMASEAIDSGKARAVLDGLIAVSLEPDPSEET